MNRELNRDIKKGLGETNIGELTPGVTGRRYEPPSGVNKHNERIHRESKYLDACGNLPFTFSKPKREARNKHVACSNCGYIASVQKDTVGMICSECKTYSSVKEVSI